MLYLHCGWSKTGTKSLQAALLRRREAMAAEGLVYPDLWQYHFGEQDISHNGLFTRIESANGSSAAIDELREFLDAHRDRDVLISAEIVTDLAMRKDARPALRTFVSTAREVMPVTCIWTLRRFDEFVRSRFLQLVSLGLDLRDPVEFMKEADASRLFTGILETEELVDRVAYLRYETGGRHNLAFLEAAGVPAKTARAIEAELEHGPRHNPSLSHKQMVTLLHCDALSLRTEFPLERERLVEAFEVDGFEFDGDFRCELVDSDMRNDLCNRALRSARTCGFQPYVRFFAGERPSSRSASVDMGPDTVTDEDLGLLVGHLREAGRT